MRILRKHCKSIRTLLLAFALLLALPLTAQATEVIEGKITIEYHGVTEKEEKIDLAGAEFILYQVGSTQGGWLLNEDFAASGITLGDATASGRGKSAAQLYAYALEKGFSGSLKSTDAQGQLVFEGLSDGLYLIAQVKDLDCDDGVFRSFPDRASL